jgi:spermidine/putrescine transport system ATP-binding protein
MQPVLQIQNITKHYLTPEGNTITALHNVSLAVNQKEFVTLLGPSGCGKTTLLRIISGFEDVDSGSIVIDKMDVTHLPANKRPVNTVFQNYALFPHLSVVRNVAYSLEVGGMTKVEARKDSSKMLDIVGLSGFEDRKINQLSGGQQQRVALARALVARPKILLLDEPLSALDKNLRYNMQKELKILQEEVGIAFVFVTHDQEEALTMSDRVAVLGNGAIQQVGSPEDLYRRPDNEFVARFIGDGNLFGGTVVDTTGPTSHIALQKGRTISLRRPGIQSGKKVNLLIRPEDILLKAAENEIFFNFEGIVEQVFFVGTDYQILINTKEGDKLKVILRSDFEKRAETPQPGNLVNLSVHKDAIHVVAD